MSAVLSIWKATVKESLARPVAFVIDVSVMIINNCTWVLLWGVLFHNTGTIRGWDLDRFLVLFAVIGVIFGLSYGLFYNVRRISLMISNGELDAALTLPVDTLAYLCVRRINASNLGDFVFGVGVFFLACHPTLKSSLLFALVSVLGCITLTAFMVLLGALTLHVGGKGEQQDIGFEAITLFTFYPLDFFGGPAKLVMYTVLPAAFLGALPADVVQHFEVTSLIWVALAAVIFSVLARVTFMTGLKKYRSGSRWTTV